MHDDDHNQTHALMLEALVESMRTQRLLLVALEEVRSGLARLTEASSPVLAARIPTLTQCIPAVDDARAEAGPDTPTDVVGPGAPAASSASALARMLRSRGKPATTCAETINASTDDATERLLSLLRKVEAEIRRAGPPEYS